MLGYIDAHTHLTDKILNGNLDAVRSNYLKENVKFIVDTGCDVDTSKKAYLNAKKFEEVYFTAGIHPGQVGENFNNDMVDIESLAKDLKCLAIGEIGLDYHYDGYNKESQIKAFVKGLELASSLNLPVVIHSRDACLDTFNVLKENSNLLKNGFLMHCYSESVETAKELLKLGAYFSFGGSLTFKNSKRVEVLKALPLDRVLFETDAPYLTPVPFRGSINEPKNVSYVYGFAIDALSITSEVLISQIDANFKALFKKICSQT